MKNITDNRFFSFALFVLTILVIAKIIWLIVSLLFLPKSGMEYMETSSIKPLYYPVKLANSSPKPPASQAIKPPVQTVDTMAGYVLLALYNASDKLVVTVEKSGKSEVLAKGEKINGFTLESAGSDYAVFTKGDKEFKLMLEGGKKQSTSGITVRPTAMSDTNNDTNKSGIVENEDGAGKVVSKGLLSSYTKDIDKVWKDIGISEHKTNGKLEGFQVSFVKQGSDFEKLGLEKGDILVSVNGQELNSYNAAFSFYKEIESIENLTLTIKRNNQEMELEYEIQ